MRKYRRLADEVLSRPKFHFSSEIVNDFITAIEEKGFYIDAAPLEVELIDPKDQIFYEVVMEERKTEDAYLVTGNIKHFPDVTYVVTPRQMLDILTGEESV